MTVVCQTQWHYRQQTRLSEERWVEMTESTLVQPTYRRAGTNPRHLSVWLAIVHRRSGERIKVHYGLSFRRRKLWIHATIVGHDVSATFLSDVLKGGSRDARTRDAWAKQSREYLELTKRSDGERYINGTAFHHPDIKLGYACKVLLWKTFETYSLRNKHGLNRLCATTSLGLCKDGEQAIGSGSKLCTLKTSLLTCNSSSLLPVEITTTTRQSVWERPATTFVSRPSTTFPFLA